MSKPADLVHGTLDQFLLKIVALEPLRAWAISQRLKLGFDRRDFSNRSAHQGINNA
jgi:hypothetical protein